MNAVIIFFDPRFSHLINFVNLCLTFIGRIIHFFRGYSDFLKEIKRVGRNLGSLHIYLNITINLKFF